MFILQDYNIDGKLDFVEKFLPLFKRGSMYIRSDHKIGMRTAMPYDSPWIHTCIDSGRVCTLYLNVIFPYLGMIHSRCHNCFKVVARPRTVSELFECFEIQNKMNLPSKSGIELRDTVEANYSCYWYNNTLKDGLECEKLIKDKLPNGIQIFLKRGCTEYEQAFGDSSKWIKTQEQLQREQVLAKNVMIEFDPSLNWPWYVALNTQRKWIRFAAARGDMTYKEKTGGKPLQKPYRLYVDKDLEGDMASPYVLNDGFPNKEF